MLVSNTTGNYLQHCLHDIGGEGWVEGVCHFYPFLSQYERLRSLVVSMLASGTQVCGFKPGRSRWIFRT